MTKLAEAPTRNQSAEASSKLILTGKRFANLTQSVEVGIKGNTPFSCKLSVDITPQPMDSTLPLSGVSGLVSTRRRTG